MELLSKEILDQIRWAKAQREAAKAKVAKVEVVVTEEDENFNPIRDLEVFESEPERIAWKMDW